MHCSFDMQIKTKAQNSWTLWLLLSLQADVELRLLLVVLPVWPPGASVCTPDCSDVWPAKTGQEDTGSTEKQIDRHCDTSLLQIGKKVNVLEKSDRSRVARVTKGHPTKTDRLRKTRQIQKVTIIPWWKDRENTKSGIKGCKENKFIRRQRK